MKLPISDKTPVDLTGWNFDFGDGLDVISKALDQWMREEAEITISSDLEIAVCLPIGDKDEFDGMIEAVVSLSDLFDDLTKSTLYGPEDLAETAAQLRALADRLDKTITAPVPTGIAAT